MIDSAAIANKQDHGVFNLSQNKWSFLFQIYDIVNDYFLFFFFRNHNIYGVSFVTIWR